VSKHEDLATSSADAGVVSRTSGDKAAHDLQVKGAGNAWGTGEAILEDDLVVRRGDEGPVQFSASVLW
jgi:hypothetical protein